MPQKIVRVIIEGETDQQIEEAYELLEDAFTDIIDESEATLAVYLPEDD